MAPFSFSFHQTDQHMNIQPFEGKHTETVVHIWQQCGLTRPWNNPYLDIQRKLTVQPELFLIGCIDENIIATAMFGYEGHRGWLNYLAVLPNHQGKGYAKQLLAYGEEQLKELGCPKLSLQIRNENQNAMRFYESLGYRMDAAVSYGKRLIED